MDLSIKEKCIIATLVLTLYFFGNYFMNSFSAYRSNPEITINLSALIRVVILVFILEIIIHSFFASQKKAEVEDERDKLIEKVSYKNGYWVMSVGMWFLIGPIFVAGAFDPQQHGITDWVNGFSNFLTPYILGNVLLFIFIVSEVTVFISQLFYYRRGV